MTKWLSVKDHKPSVGSEPSYMAIECIVVHELRPWSFFRAFYDPYDNIYYLGCRDHEGMPVVDVTHFIQIPMLTEANIK
jgi:hypothetical protein